MILLFRLKSIFNTIVCDLQKKNILKSICQRCNNLKLTCIFNGQPNIDRTTQSATMGGPMDHPWFLPILHTDHWEFHQRQTNWHARMRNYQNKRAFWLSNVRHLQETSDKSDLHWQRLSLNSGKWFPNIFDNLIAYRYKEMIFFHTQLWFPASDHDFRGFGSGFWCFCEVMKGKKHCGRNRIDHGHPCGMELTLMNLYSTEITCNLSCFLEYKLTWLCSSRVPVMNSVFLILVKK